MGLELTTFKVVYGEKDMRHKKEEEEGNCRRTNNGVLLYNNSLVKKLRTLLGSNLPYYIDLKRMLEGITYREDFTYMLLFIQIQ